jgi:hypothetical protein
VSYYLYRAYDGDGRLLYVGLASYHVEERMKGHIRQGSVWLDQLAHITVEKQHSNWDIAAAAEREAIKTEWPLYNIQHSVEGPRPPHLILQTRCPDVTPEQLRERERRVTQALRAANLLRPPRSPEARFLREVDPNNELPEQERLRRATEARQAHYQRVAAASLEGRRKAREARKAAVS